MVVRHASRNPAACGVLIIAGSLVSSLHPAAGFLVSSTPSAAFSRADLALRSAPRLTPAFNAPGRLGAARGPRVKLQMQVELAGVVESLQAQVAALTLDDIAGGLFAFSLFPYLGFLYHLGKEENKTPELGLFGFKFLLAFVAASIPAAIAAKILYGAQLADVDYLHGGAESFLALTNLFIVLGFRRAVAGAPGYKDAPVSELLSSPIATSGALAGSLFLATHGVPGDMLALSSAHVEPANALSFPTWMVHTSSLIEWLTAMGLVWRYADVSGNPRWKGLTWGMLPFHSSGLCACTYHVFYNAAPVGGLVAMQSALTVVGDFTCWYAAYRIFEYASANPSGNLGEAAGKAAAAGLESEASYFGKLTALCVAASALVKWGELQLDFPFEPSYPAALAMIGVPTALNVLTWVQRSRSDSNTFNEFY